jgi:hypothetical protein
MDKVEIDAETADGIVVASLKDQIRMLRSQLKKYMGKRSLSAWEKDDLKDTLETLEYLEKTFDYYGGRF